MTTNWTKKYTDPGIPFVAGGRDFSGCDCGGLVLLALKEEKGIIAKDFSNYNPKDFATREGYKHLAKLVEDALIDWPVTVDRPIPFDLVRMEVGSARCHVGLYVGNGYFLHIEDAMGSIARLTSLDDLGWGRNIFEYRRHKAFIDDK